MIYFCLFLVLIFIVIITLNIMIQKDFFYKLLLFNSLTNIITVFIFFFGSFKANSSYFDVALIYLMLSFIASAAYLKYFSQKNYN